jgi:hypothetical protein
MLFVYFYVSMSCFLSFMGLSTFRASAPGSVICQIATRPFSGGVQLLAFLRGVSLSLTCSGIVISVHIRPPDTSNTSLRQSIGFHETLYARHSTGNPGIFLSSDLYHP